MKGGSTPASLAKLAFAARRDKPPSGQHQQAKGGIHQVEHPRPQVVEKPLRKPALNKTWLGRIAAQDVLPHSQRAGQSQQRFCCDKYNSDEMHHAEGEPAHPMPPECSADPDAWQAENDDTGGGEVDDKHAVRDHRWYNHDLTTVKVGDVPRHILRRSP